MLNPKKMSQTFSKPRAMLNKTKKTNVPWHHPCICTLRDHGQRPITAPVAFTSLYNVICLTDGVCIIFLNMKIKFLSKTIVLRSVFRLLYSLFCKLNQAFSLLVYIYRCSFISYFPVCLRKSQFSHTDSRRWISSCLKIFSSNISGSLFYSGPCLTYIFL